MCCHLLHYAIIKKSIFAQEQFLRYVRKNSICWYLLQRFILAVVGGQLEEGGVKGYPNDHQVTPGVLTP